MKDFGASCSMGEWMDWGRPGRPGQGVRPDIRGNGEPWEVIEARREGQTVGGKCGEGSVLG